VHRLEPFWLQIGPSQSYRREFQEIAVRPSLKTLNRPGEHERSVRMDANVAFPVENEVDWVPVFDKFFKLTIAVNIQ
jgi:hypothetical protein